MSLSIRVEASAGDDLREAMIDMVGVARRTGTRIELRGNDTTFWVDPDDTEQSARDAFDRLYPGSRLVASWIGKPAPRRLPNDEKQRQNTA